jgi:hypothetical protein
VSWDKPSGSPDVTDSTKCFADTLQQAALEGLQKQLDTFVPRVQQVIRQAKQRVFEGNTHVAEKLVSMFELVVPALEAHHQKLGRASYLLTGLLFRQERGGGHRVRGQTDRARRSPAERAASEP